VAAARAHGRFAARCSCENLGAPAERRIRALPVLALGRLCHAVVATTTAWQSGHAQTMARRAEGQAGNS
jgi:hypothetical protein